MNYFIDRRSPISLLIADILKQKFGWRDGITLLYKSKIAWLDMKLKIQKNLRKVERSKRIKVWNEEMLFLLYMDRLLIQAPPPHMITWYMKENNNHSARKKIQKTNLDQRTRIIEKTNSKNKLDQWTRNFHKQALIILFLKKTTSSEHWSIQTSHKYHLASTQVSQILFRFYPKT